MKVLITGANGFIGSHVLERVQKDHETIATSRQTVGRSANYVPCDIGDSQAIYKLLESHADAEAIIHCAAIAHNKGDSLSLDRFMRVNYQAVADLVDASNVHMKLKQFIFLSTISVYGEKPDVDVYSEKSELTPKSPYAVAKKEAEAYIQKNCRSPYFILRLSPVYSKMFLLNIQRRTAIASRNYMVGDGGNRLSLLHVENITHAISEILAERVPANNVYNLADRDPYTFRDMLAVNVLPGGVLSVPSAALRLLRTINKYTFQKTSIEENLIKLLTDNIYSTQKIRQYIELPYTLRNLDA